MCRVGGSERTSRNSSTDRSATAHLITWRSSRFSFTTFLFLDVLAPSGLDCAPLVEREATVGSCDSFFAVVDRLELLRGGIWNESDGVEKGKNASRLS